MKSYAKISKDMKKNGQLCKDKKNYAKLFEYLNKYLFHSEILASLNFNKNKICSPVLNNNHSLKYCSGNFPT